MSRLTFSRSYWRAALLFLGALILSGCATGPATLHTQVNSYNDWSALPTDKSYSFSRTLKFQNSLELNGYEALVRDELNKLGFKESSTPAAARLLVTLHPAIIRASWGSDPFFADPFWPRFGVGFYGGYRSIYGRPFYPYPYYSGYYPFSHDTPTYLRSLRLEIDVQGAPLKRVYEGTVQTEGWDDSLPKAMPYLVRAMFSDFPGNNGETRNVNVVIDK